jgi:hypothetical protein
LGFPTGWSFTTHQAGRLNHVNAAEAEEAPDVVLGTFLVNSVPAKILFDWRITFLCHGELCG